MQAKDIMHRQVATVRPETPLRELVKLLDERGISGAPVVGPRGDLIGVVSRTDLMSGERAGAPLDPALKVESVMTPWAVSFEEDTPVEELARQMLAKDIHRVVITREGRLCGIVTSMDMMRALLTLLGERARS